MQFRFTTALLLAAALGAVSAAQAQQPQAAKPAPAPLSAEQSDPLRMGWMQGSPPPIDKQVRWDDGSAFQFPQTRWAFSNEQALMPTATVRREGPASRLEVALRDDLDAVPFQTLDGQKLTWGEAFDAYYADGIIVLHKGKVVYERYAGALQPDGRHIAMSVTKSFVGTLALLLADEGKLDVNKTVASYVPELTDSGFGDATVQQVLDMRTAIEFDEEYTGTGLTDVARMTIAGGLAPAPADYDGPMDNYAFVQSIEKNGRHGGDFVYRTPNTNVAQWVIERVGGAPLAVQLAARIWKPMGMDQEATIIVDRIGTAFGGGGLNANLRDMARFGEMIRQGGMWNGKRILPESVARAILAKGDTKAFEATKYRGLEGGSYSSFWWHSGKGQTMAQGVFGQIIYIDPAAEMVIARFASNPVASNRDIHPITLPAFAALAAHLNR